METAVEILARVSHSDKIVAEALVNKSVPVLIEVAEKSEDKDRVLDLISRMLMAKKHKSKSSPEYAPALLSLCDKCLGSNERPIRDAAMRSLRFGREAFHYSLIEDALVQGFTLSVKDPEYLFVAEKIELTAVLGEIDAQKVEDWVGSVLPFGPGSEQNIQILVGLSCRQSDRYTVQLFPELLKALHAPGLRLTAISAIHSICAKSPETQYAFFISDQRLLDQIFDMKEITNEEIEKCKPLVRLTGQKMVNEKQLPKLQDIVARFFSGDSSSVPDVLYETLLCSLSQPIVNGLDWKEGFTASIENQERKAVSKVLGSVLNKSSDLKAVQPYLGELGKAKHVGKLNTTYQISIDYFFKLILKKISPSFHHKGPFDEGLKRRQCPHQVYPRSVSKISGQFPHVHRCSAGFRRLLQGQSLPHPSILQTEVLFIHISDPDATLQR